MAIQASSAPAKAPVLPSFEIDSERVVVPTISFENVKASGLRLCRAENLGQFYDVAGHRSLLMGSEGRDFEVWIYPFKAFQDCEIGFFIDHTVIWGDTIRKTFSITPEAAVVTYEIPGLKATQTIFAPVKEPGIVMLFKVASKKPVHIVARLRQDLKLMWPADASDLEPEIGRDKGSGAWVVRSKDGHIAALAGWAGGESHPRLPDDPTFDGCIVTASETDPNHLCSLVFAGSTEGIDVARDSWVKLAKNPYELLQAAANYYHELDTETLSVSTPDKCLNEAFRWAKVGLDKCYKVTPDVGAGFVAGFNRSGESGRPGFGWYFGRDSSWTGFSFNGLGLFQKTRNNLELLGKYQIREGDNRGKIFHEISAAHDSIPEDKRDYAYPAGDSTPFYVIDMADYLRWTGDIEFVKANWQRVVDAMDWCSRMDVDGDHLIDNPPAGHEWYDYGEKNMLDLVAIWLRALESAAEMAEMLGEKQAAGWREEAQSVRKIINTDFWDDSQGYLYDRKLPDGSMTRLTTANPTAPLLWGQVDEPKAQKAIDRMVQPDLTVPWGMRTNSSKDPIFKPGGYHEGTVWPLVTGWASLACFNNHRGAEGFAYLKANFDLTRDFCLGYITEVLDGGKRSPAGCPHQAWSEAMIVQPSVEGLLGIRVDAVKKQITFVPHLPDDWSSVKVRNLKAGDNTFEIAYEHKDRHARICVKQTAGSGKYHAAISPSFEKSVKQAKVLVNGEQAEAKVEQTLTDTHVTITAAINAKLVVEMDVE